MKIENRFFWQPSPPTCIGTEQLQCDPRSLVPALVSSRSPSPLSGSCIWSLSRRVRRAESCRSLHAYSALPEYVHTHAHTHTHTLTLTHTLTVIPSHSVCPCAVCAKSLQSCPALCDLMDCSLPGSSAHGILQARILEWVAVPSSRGSPPPRDQTLRLLHLQAGSLPLGFPGGSEVKASASSAGDQDSHGCVVGAQCRCQGQEGEAWASAPAPLSTAAVTRQESRGY